MASGKNGSRPTPYCSQAGMRSASIRRSSSEYSFWALTNAVVWPVRAVHAASATCHPLKLDEPMYRTFPARTRSSNVDRVSAIGVAWSGWCIW